MEGWNYKARLMPCILPIDIVVICKMRKFRLKYESKSFLPESLSRTLITHALASLLLVSAGLERIIRQISKKLGIYTTLTNIETSWETVQPPSK